LSVEKPTQVFVCDVCGSRSVVPFDGETPAYVLARGSIISIGRHRYEAGPCCTRGVWRYLAYVRRFHSGPMPGGEVGQPPYVYEPAPAERWSEREEAVMAKLTGQMTSNTPTDSAAPPSGAPPGGITPAQ
jgi:hypothetical protein